jgi:hypothetical protein
MQNNRFVVLTGHLSNYPLSDLVGILRHQRKTGRLLIEYAKGPATFFFQEGELIDARLNDLTGLQAICVALAQPEAAFNFNPLIPPSRRSIDVSLQRAVSELFGCWDESALQIETTAATTSLQTKPEPLALPPAPRSTLQQRSVLFVAAAVLIGVGLSTVIAVTGAFTGNPPAAAAQASPLNPPNPLPVVTQVENRPVSAPAKPSRRSPEPRPVKTSETDKQPSETDQKLQSIKVVMQIENGRVLKASIANHKPGMDSYEALALRIARQRRYPTTVTGGETVTISVSKPE